MQAWRRYDSRHRTTTKPQRRSASDIWQASGDRLAASMHHRPGDDAGHGLRDRGGGADPRDADGESDSWDAEEFEDPQAPPGFFDPNDFDDDFDADLDETDDPDNPEDFDDPDDDIDDELDAPPKPGW